MSEKKVPVHVFDVTQETYGDTTPVKSIVLRIGTTDLNNIDKSAMHCLEALLTPLWEGAETFTVMQRNYLQTQEVPANVVTETLKMARYEEYLMYRAKWSETHYPIPPLPLEEWLKRNREQ